MRCDFCRSPQVRWRYPTGNRDWRACEKCQLAIEADDREALLDRVMLAPVPRTVPERYASRYRQQARALHEEFWTTAPRPGEPA